MKAATRRWAGLASRDLPFSRSPPPLFSSVPTYVVHLPSPAPSPAAFVLLRSSSHASSLSSSFPTRRLSCQAKTALLSSLCSFERGYVTVAGDLDKRTRAQLAWERERWHLRQRKKDPNSAEPSKNKLFRMTPVEPKLLNYINRHKLGLRRDEPLPLSHAKRKKELAETRTEIDKLWEKKVRFIAGATTRESFVTPTLPEAKRSHFCVLGRSNVGKSSLINALTMQGKVRVSDSPGETRQINWYRVGKHINLVDLPGYGFAYASEATVRSWTELMRDFLITRKSLKRICVLIDARHGFKSSDIEFLDMLEQAKRKYQIVFTKADLVEPENLARRYYLVQKELKERRHALERIMMVSAWNGAGLSALRTELMNLMTAVPQKNPVDSVLPDYHGGDVQKSPQPTNATKSAARRPSAPSRRKPVRRTSPARQERPGEKKVARARRGAKTAV